MEEIHNSFIEAQSIWDLVPDWALFIAQDADGEVWCYNTTPAYSHEMGHWVNPIFSQSFHAELVFESISLIAPEATLLWRNTDGI